MRLNFNLRNSRSIIVLFTLFVGATFLSSCNKNNVRYPANDPLKIRLHADLGDLYFSEELPTSATEYIKIVKDDYDADNGVYTILINKFCNGNIEEWKKPSTGRLIIERNREEVAVLGLTIEAVRSRISGKKGYVLKLLQVKAINGCTVEQFSPAKGDDSQSVSDVYIKINN